MSVSRFLGVGIRVVAWPPGAPAAVYDEPGFGAVFLRSGGLCPAVMRSTESAGCDKKTTGDAAGGGGAVEARWAAPKFERSVAERVASLVRLVEPVGRLVTGGGGRSSSGAVGGS